MPDVIPLPPPPIVVTLHAFIAFDWGDGIDMERVRTLAPASTEALARRRRTPASFSFQPPPLQITLPNAEVELGSLGTTPVQVSVTIFDFAAVSVNLRATCHLGESELTQLASSLADAEAIVQQVRALLQPLHAQLLPAIQDPQWRDDLYEEYFVVQLPPEALPLASNDAWLASVVHLEGERLSAEEIAEALRYRISYGPDDLLVTDWGAAILFDRDCEETLQAIAFANLQFLEFRHIDGRLDLSLATASQLIAPPKLGLHWRLHNRQLRVLGELKVEANVLFERTGNALKLVGDPYLARVYRLVAKRFHLETWVENIQRKLEAAEGVYQVVVNQASHVRAEFLEITVIVLILIEVVAAFVRH